MDVKRSLASVPKTNEELSFIRMTEQWKQSLTALEILDLNEKFYNALRAAYNEGILYGTEKEKENT